MESHAWNRRVLDAVAEGIWVIDLDGHTIEANPAVATLLRLEPQDLPGLDLANLLDEEGRTQFASHLAGLRDGRINPGEVECLFHLVDATTVWVAIREAFVRDDDDHPVAVVLNTTDITSRKVLLDSLRESERQRAEAERIARLGSWQWTAEDDSYEVSDGIRALYGERTDEIFSGSDAFIASVHPDDRERIREALRTAMDTGQDFEFEGRVRAQSGYVWIRGRGVGAHDDRGTLVSASGTHQDVTRTRATDDALQDLVTQNSLLQAVASAANEAATLDSVLSQAKDLVLLHDDWDRARAFLPVDDGRELAPYYIDEEDRARYEGPSHDPLRDRELTTALRALHEKRSVWDDETRLTIAFRVMLEEECVAVLAITSLPPLYRHDMVQHMVEQVADQLALVAERERAAAALGQARDLAMEASQHKSDFLATMSHEIRTPLNGIIGLTELLGRTVLDERQRHLVSGVDLSSRSLLALINDILDFSKIEAGRLELEIVDFEVRDLLDQVAGVLAESARAKSLDFQVSCSPDVPQVASGDPTRLLQVLTNLGSNAVKFTAEGEVAIRATVVGPADAPRLRVDVRDTGIGVAPDRVESIFSPFLQGDSSTTRHFGGTGLGLAISQEIVEAAGGSIGVDSEEGHGSTFWMQVPLLPPTGALLGETTDGARAELRGTHVLVVDDNMTNRHILTEQLAWWDVTCVAVASPAEALDTMISHEFDLVLLDMAMPDVDGLGLARAIRERESADEHLPLILLTSSLLPDEVAPAAAGIDLCLSKPVSSAHLRDVLLGIRRQESAPHAPAPVARRTERILVVEDNAVNRLVATGLLDGLGLSADTADDGDDAVAMVEQCGYDLILMDVQMPRLDGYATTRALRNREADLGLGRTPIVAMTASAVSGERERALASGMDDFVSKPVNSSRLAEVVSLWIDADDADDVALPAPAPRPIRRPAHDVLDRSRLEELAELSPAYVSRVIASFHERLPAMIDAVRRAADGADLASSAHALKGASSNIGLVHVSEIAEHLEGLGRSDGTASEPSMTELVAAAEHGLVALDDFVATMGPSN
ncbi:response regulator [Nocardioides sp.]|uniref:response regulator n=1 Tax=Nocardioides sp. TaxID=35761 RepID=UPI00262B3C57|nr:response regulator [Nocardioides sp.]